MKNLVSKKTKKKIDIVMNIIFADAKNSWDRMTSLVSAIFWTWLELTFLVFFFTYSFGIAGYIVGGSYAYSFETLRANKDFMHIFIWAFVVLIFVLRIPIHYGKKVEK